MHPADEIRGVKSKRLLNKKIILAVTGSIAAVETIKLARELIRHGAQIIPVMTPSATKIIHPDALWFATGNKPITEITGETEHVKYCGRVKKPADLLLVCPCTANTISKIAHGIDDTSATTFATTAIGSKIPILIVPAMHLSMYGHKIIQKNIKKCETAGIKILELSIEKNKAKMSNIQEIIANVFREIDKKDLKNKKILIIGGPTAESIDDIRIITNRSSGKTAVSLAKNAFYRGADVDLLYGYGKEYVPEHINKTDFESIKDIQKFINKKNLKEYDIIIICAALSDYMPKKQKGKIPSGMDKLSVDMSPAPKIISQIRKKTPETKIIGFKAEEKTTKLKEKAFNLLKKNNLDFVIANTISGFSNESNDIWIINKNKKTVHKKGKKEILADFILDTIK
jgi:phosphopantothenoylcysteine decarboxylase/phosphopantothenate--cysteine ligase